MQNNEIISVLGRVTEVFNDLGIAYYISGSVASSSYGLSRTTRDIDIVSPISLPVVKALVEKFKNDFYIDDAMIREAIKTKSSFNIIHLETMLKIDVFLLKDDPFHRKAFERKRLDNFGNEENSIQIYLPSAEDIILHKIEWYKIGGEISERQWSDILGVIKIQKNNLDKKYLKYWAKELKIDNFLEKAFIDSDIP